MAGNMMTFPDTWEEFEKQYGFYDSKQEYTLGILDLYHVLGCNNG